MKRKIAIYILLLSLLGLMVIQFRLLVIGVKLEKQRFDERVRISLQEMNLNIADSPTFGDSLGVILRNTYPRKDTSNLKIVQTTTEELQQTIVQHLDKKGISANFTFAITDRYGEETLLSSQGFVKKSFHFDYYSVLLDEKVTAQAYGERMLHLDIQNLFNYLLGELNYLVIPSILFLITLLICLWFLVRMLRKEERLNEVKNEFINNLTHELKTPVFSISLASNLLKEHVERGNLEKAQQFLTMIVRENERLKTHIDKVLELATLESPNYQLEKHSTDFNELVRESVNDFKIKVEDKNGTLQSHFWQQPLMVNLDTTHFKNVVQNLLENALKYSTDKVEIVVTTQSIEDAIQLIISDKGMGIPIEFHKDIFEKFYRVPHENLHEVKGFGLGLNYVKKIVEAHDGQISVKSEVEKGTTFKITIPIAN